MPASRATIIPVQFQQGILFAISAFAPEWYGEQVYRKHLWPDGTWRDSTSDGVQGYRVGYAGTAANRRYPGFFRTYRQAVWAAWSQGLEVAIPAATPEPAR